MFRHKYVRNYTWLVNVGQAAEQDEFGSDYKDI
jgi:hypothetical protein